MNKKRPSINRETGMPLTPTRLAFSPGGDFRLSLGEFYTIPARQELARSGGSIALLSVHAESLDLGNGREVDGEDTEKHDPYELKVAESHEDSFALIPDTTKSILKDGSVRLGFGIRFEPVSLKLRDVKNERQRLIGKPLFSPTYKDSGHLPIFTQIPPAFRVDDKDIEEAYENLQAKMKATAHDGMASAGMYVTGARVHHQWPKTGMR